MATTGLFVPLSVVMGDTLDIPFDISKNGAPLDPSLVTFQGQITLSSDDIFPEDFTFTTSDDDAFITHASLSSDITSGLAEGKYTYQIRFANNTDTSSSIDNTGNVTTILYGTLTVLHSTLSLF